MSDEEKKAYDNLIMLKYFTMGKEDKQAIDTILNLIEKQQKEIEEAEQKEKKAYIDGTNVAHELCNKMWKDKIKAKIEELEKQQKEEPDAYLCIKVLRSLLEKEWIYKKLLTKM